MILSFKIEGITIAELKNLLNQFADDMDIFSLASEQSIKSILEELDKFKYQSGFTVSYDKTTLYRIGSLRHSDAQMYNMDTYAWSNKDINVLGVTIAHDNLVEKNYDVVITKVKSTLNAWYNRGLSLIAKVQVVNTLIASLFVYKMMVLPSIPEIVVKRIDNLIREFLWAGKKAKISYKILQNPKSDGGLNLVNLVNKDRALKATWPYILYQEPDYAKLVYHLMGVSELGDNIWRCNIKIEDIKKLRITEKFWEDVLKGWNLYNTYNNQPMENQILWYNSAIKVDGKIILWKPNVKKGLLYVHQLFEDREFISYERAEQDFGLSVMDFNSLKTALPREWKNFFQSTDKLQYMPSPPHAYDICISSHAKGWSQKIYKWLSDDVMLLHNKYLSCKEELGIDLCPSLYEYGREHLSIFKLTNVTKYRSFQYRLMQRGIVTNVHLKKWKIKECEMCSFCGLEKETLCHLFANCREVVDMWGSFIEYVKQKFNVTELVMTEKNILLNQVVQQTKYHVVNFLCLVVKQYIYSQRCFNEKLNWQHAKAAINRIENIEKYIAIKNNKVEVHNRKWLKLKDQDLSTSDYIQQYLQAMPQ